LINFLKEMKPTKMLQKRLMLVSLFKLWKERKFSNLSITTSLEIGIIITMMLGGIALSHTP